MKTLIVGKMLLNDDHLVGSRNWRNDLVKDVISAGLVLTPFSTTKIDLVYARVAEKYYLECKRQGYNNGFFKDYSFVAVCRLNQENTAVFDGVYVPFTGRIYILPKDILEFAEAPSENYEARIFPEEEGKKQFLRRFKLNLEVNDEPSKTVEKPIKKLKAFFTGLTSNGGERKFTVKRITSLIADADIEEDGEKRTEYPPMTFLDEVQK